MQAFFALGALVLLILLVILRVRILGRAGIKAVHFGKMDKKDFLIPPFVLLFFYMIAAFTFGLPVVGGLWTEHGVLRWIGVLLCMAAIGIFLWGLFSFGRSFRIGIDEDRPDKLITSGAFAFSRNPLYLGFLFMLSGILLVFPTWFFLFYFGGGIWLINRQIEREEDSLGKIYGEEYRTYCKTVRRYL